MQESRAAITLHAPAGEPQLQVDADDLGRVVHEEINRLPEHYRAPVVLCDLEGQTHEQAARHLGWPMGTVKSRLTKARERLRGRLTRRGLSPTAGAWALPLSIRAIPGITLPEPLVATTASAAVRFLASRTLLGGTAAILAQGVITAMSMTRLWKAASLILVAGATVSGAGLIGGTGRSSAGPAAQDPANAPNAPQAKAEAEEAGIATVEVSDFTRRIGAVGTIEASKFVDLRSEIKGATTILSIVPEGMNVKQGDIVCELDSSNLRDQLVNQRPVSEAAKSAVENANLEYEAADLALREYEEGILPSERASIQGEIKLAESSIEKTKARVERTRKALQRLERLQESKAASSETPSEVAAMLSLEDRADALEQTIEREQLSLESWKNKLSLLDKITAPRTIRELKAGLEQRAVQVREKKEKSDLESDRLHDFKTQINECKLQAPFDGVVVYKNDPQRRNGPPQIEEGATVRERQLIVRIVKLDNPMLLSAKVAESEIDRVKPGQKVSVAINAFPEEHLTGEVAAISPLPDPPPFARDNQKVYTVQIRLNEEMDGLRPGMTASAEIVYQTESMLSIPSKVVTKLQGKNFVVVRRKDGTFESRQVVILHSDQDRVAIQSGLEAGEQVVPGARFRLIGAKSQQKDRTPVVDLSIQVP